MIELRSPFRYANENDGAVLAELANRAGHGMALHLWSSIARPGEDPWIVGSNRIVSTLDERVVIVADEGGGVFAQVTSYAIGSDPRPLDEIPPMLIPTRALENEALDSWKIFTLGVAASRRGQGWGTKLLALSEEVARSKNWARMSLIVADNNQLARRLYKRTGFREIARRQIIKNGWITEGKFWILMTRSLR